MSWEVESLQRVHIFALAPLIELVLCVYMVYSRKVKLFKSYLFPQFDLAGYFWNFPLQLLTVNFDNNLQWYFWHFPFVCPQGFVSAVNNMRSFVPAIYDCTVIVPKDSPPPTMLRILKGQSSVVRFGGLHIYCFLCPFLWFLFSNGSVC